MHGVAQKVSRGSEIRVENGDQFAVGVRQSGLERAGLVPDSILAAAVFDRMPRVPQLLRFAQGESMRLVGRVVERLDLQQLPRVIDPAGGFQQLLDNEALVVNRQLHRDPGQPAEAPRGLRHRGAAMPVIEKDQVVAVQAVQAQHRHEREIQTDRRRIRRDHVRYAWIGFDLLPSAWAGGRTIR